MLESPHREHGDLGHAAVLGIGLIALGNLVAWLLSR